MATDRSTHDFPLRPTDTRHRDLKRRPARLGKALLLGALLLPLAACGGHGGMMTGSPRGGDGLESPYGSFLAARHARITNENGLATEYYLQALQEDPASSRLAQGDSNGRATGRERGWRYV